MLAEAAEMEHNLLCSYLYAAFSLRKPGEALDEVEASAVERWRKSVLGIAVQEMGHLATVNNLMVALGGAAHFDRANFPIPPGYLPASFAVRLSPFDEDTLEHFIFLERPEKSSHDDAEDYAHGSGVARGSGALGATPSAEDYSTIGELYGCIRRALRLFSASSGARAFVNLEAQVSAEQTGIAGVIVIRDLASAFAALAHIVDQGEGAAADTHDSHFARFKTIQDEWRALAARNPGFRPAHPAARDPVMRRPADGAERVWVTASPAAALVDYGNAVYGALITLLSQLYLPSEPSQKSSLAACAMELMHALSVTGSALARLPAAADAPGVNAGLSFAVPRARGPRSDNAVIAERLAELAPLHERLFGGDCNPVRAALARLSP
jgi:hypothetical protein